MCTKALCSSALGCFLCGIPRNLNSHHPGLPHSTELFALLCAYFRVSPLSCPHQPYALPLPPPACCKDTFPLQSESSPSPVCPPPRLLRSSRKLCMGGTQLLPNIPPGLSRGLVHSCCARCEMLSSSPLLTPCKPQEAAQRKLPPAPNT